VVVTRVLSRPNRRQWGGAFSLIELLVVLGIIGILAVVSLPGLRSIGKTSSSDSAAQQLVDDLNLARARAINGRTTVHVVFVPPSISTMTFGPADAQKTGNLLLDAPFRSYRLFAERRVGDQPGRPFCQYVDEWKTLPDGVLIATNHFAQNPPPTWPNGTLETIAIPFPTLDARTNVVPHIAFGPEGSPVDANGNRIFQAQFIQIALGSVLSKWTESPRTLLYYDVRELPPGRGSGNPVRIRIDGFTGRAGIDRPQIQ
jgi:prepilin-type N-terminal cleavage/methylation domain-containing protein